MSSQRIYAVSASASDESSPLLRARSHTRRRLLHFLVSLLMIIAGLILAAFVDIPIKKAVTKSTVREHIANEFAVLASNPSTVLYCQDIEYASCIGAACRAIPNTDLFWCECSVQQGAASLVMSVRNAYLLWSATYRHAYRSIMNGRIAEARNLTCGTKFWLEGIVPGIASDISLISLGALGNNHSGDFREPHVEEQDSKCHVSLAGCMGAPCFATNSGTAMCACPLHAVNASATSVSRALETEGYDHTSLISSACSNPDVCSIQVAAENVGIPVEWSLWSAEHTVRAMRTLTSEAAENDTVPC